MGLCSKWIIFKKGNNREVTDVVNVKEDKIIDRINSKEEAIRIVITSEEAEIELGGKKKYLTTKVNIKSLNIKET